MNQDIVNAFCKKAPLEINMARIEHIKTLNLNFENKKILETGCGGKGDFTMFLLKNGASVTLNDARIENIKHLLELNNLDLEYNTTDLNVKIEDHEKYDIIFCYGTLYHLHNPIMGIENMYKLCNGFLLLSTVVNSKNDISIDYVSEDSNSKEQSYTNIGCRPSRKWVMNELKKHFKFVYTSKTQPNHPDFKTDWTVQHTDTCRAIFLATDIENFVDLKLWSEYIL
jgi:2-polyprenyl-3-methyl-5-hydroxy-6-metoxy-1,4-benzoquinol methylase